MRWRAWIAACGASLLLGSGTAAAGLLGGRRGVVPAESSIWLPDWAAAALSWVVRQQSEFGQALRGGIIAYRDTSTLAPAILLIGLSFAYGVFHAVGPGHGKAVVTSYFMARESAIRRGLAMGWLIAAVQAAVAILTVGLLGWVLSFSRMALLDSMSGVETGAYAMIVLLGVTMTWRALRGGHGHDPDHEQGRGNQGRGHDHGPPSDRAPGSLWEFLAVGIVSGLRPCSGSLIVLLFALANGIFGIGILAALAIGCGVALTVSGVGVTAILSRRGLICADRLAGGGGQGVLAAFLPRAFGALGALAILLIGLILLLASLSAWPKINV